MYSILAGLALVATPVHRDLMTDVRAALHVDSAAWSSTLLTGKASYYSVPHTFSFQFDPQGKFLQIINGPLGETYAYDGNDYWMADRTGAPRILHFEDQDIQQASLLVQTDQWLNPPDGVKVASDDTGV